MAIVAGGVGVSHDATPFSGRFSRIYGFQMWAILALFLTNRRVAKFPLNKAEIRMCGNCKQAPIKNRFAQKGSSELLGKPNPPIMGHRWKWTLMETTPKRNQRGHRSRTPDCVSFGGHFEGNIAFRPKFVGANRSFYLGNTHSAPM